MCTWPLGVSVHVYECVYVFACVFVYISVSVRVSLCRCECIICV